MIKTILLADDSITMQKVIRLTFANGGYELHCADNGDEALKKAEELKPHIVLVDAALPGKDGYEVCRAIKNNPDLRDTPVIILAGTFNPLDDEKAIEVEADDSIVKPFESRHLTEKVESLFRKYPPGEVVPSAGVTVNGTPDWAEDDVIRAPEPTPAATEPPISITDEPAAETIESTSELPDLDIMEGRGIIEEPPPEAEEARIPDMETAEGESECENGFDIEGFEINPFKSEALREASPVDEEDEGISAWNVDERDLVAFNDLETEKEIEVETSQPFADGDEGFQSIEEPGQEVLGEETAEESGEAVEETSEPDEDTIRAEEETSEPDEDSEEDAVRKEVVEMPSEEWIRELVRKTTLETIEEVVSDSAPGLVKEAMEEVVRDIVPELIKEAMDEEMERIKKAIRGL
ncbi:MAG: response regulator [Thermodesulfobacteriota bacterium]